MKTSAAHQQGIRVEDWRQDSESARDVRSEQQGSRPRPKISNLSRRQRGGRGRPENDWLSCACRAERKCGDHMAEYAEQIYMFVAGAHQIHQRIPGVRGHPPGLRPESTNHKSSTHALGRVRRADFIAHADSCADIHHGKKEFCA
jgi:hypothetical protein